MGILEWLSLESASVSSYNVLEDLLFILYVAVSIGVRKSRYLLAFSFSMLLVTCSLFDSIQEYQLYLTIFIVYSYVCLHSDNKRIFISCGIMCLLDLLLAYDAFYYGIGGTHGANKTFVYKNIEYFAFSANILIILSLVSFGRIYDCLCNMLDHAFGLKTDSFNMLFFWYNTIKIK
jgi:hypothetical protein